MAHAISMSQDELLHAVVAEYQDADEILVAAKKIRAAGYSHLDAYTPLPVHGLDDAIGFKDSKVQWTIFLAGVTGALTGMLTEIWVSTQAYPLNVGGRPKVSWPSFIPVAYECTILFAGFAAFFSVLIFNKLPRPNHPIFNTPNFDRATQDRYFLSVEVTDPNFDMREIKRVLEETKPVKVSEVYGDEPEGAA